MTKLPYGISSAVDLMLLMVAMSDASELSSEAMVSGELYTEVDRKVRKDWH